MHSVLAKIDLDAIFDSFDIMISEEGGIFVLEFVEYSVVQEGKVLEVELGKLVVISAVGEVTEV